MLDHAVQPLGFIGIAVDRVLDLFRRIDAEVVRLSQHRADAAQGEGRAEDRRAAQLELPEGGWEREEVIERIRTKYPVMEIVRCRRRLDPHNILGNPTLDVLFPTGAKPKSHA